MTELFDAKYISAAVAKQLRPGFIVRPLASNDYEKGFLDCLAMLTQVGQMSKSDYIDDRFNYMKARNDQYFTIVIEDTDASKIVGAGTILVERKFIHHNGLVGHIEDIVTHSGYRGMNLGKFVIETLKHIGDLSGQNVPFYEKCGFEKKEVEMVHYIKSNDTPNSMAKL